MKTIQTVRAVYAILFLFCGFLLTRYAAQNEGTWYIVIGCLGIVTAVLGIVAVFLFLREFIKGFSRGNSQPKTDLVSPPFNQDEKVFEMFKYIIEQETKDGKEFNLIMHNSTCIFQPLKRNIRLNPAGDEIIMTACETPYPNFPHTVVLKKEGIGNNGLVPNDILIGHLFEALHTEGYILKYKDQIKQLCKLFPEDNMLNI